MATVAAWRSYVPFANRLTRRDVAREAARPLGSLSHDESRRGGATEALRQGVGPAANLKLPPPELRYSLAG